MDSRFWLKKWENEKIGFHRPVPNPFLVKYFSSAAPQHILVPLCGKSIDMLWLASQKHKVLGVELSPIACQDFFDENNLTYTQEKSGSGTLFRGEKISIYCGDFFTLPTPLWKNITTIYDRAALIALPPEMRERYAETIQKNWKPQKHETFYLLITVEKAAGDLSGPPFSVTETEVNRLFGDAFNVTTLASKKEPEGHSGGVLLERAALLNLKQ